MTHGKRETRGEGATHDEGETHGEGATRWRRRGEGDTAKANGTGWSEGDARQRGGGSERRELSALTKENKKKSAPGCSVAPRIVVAKFGSELWFEPNFSKLNHKFSSWLIYLAELNQWSDLQFRLEVISSNWFEP
jgi:hypothetical protein